jgi:hypothetical protein
MQLYSYVLYLHIVIWKLLLKKKTHKHVNYIASLSIYSEFSVVGEVYSGYLAIPVPVTIITLS